MNDLNVIWQIATGFGVLVQFALVVDSWLNLRALRRRGRNGPARIVALANLRNDSMRLAIHALLFSAGPSLPLDLLAPSVVARLYIVVAIAIAIGLWTGIDRRRLLHEVGQLLDRVENGGR